MIELWLKFNNEYGEPQNVRVDRENFIIGRSPDNDLSIPRSQLSRSHAEINRFSSSYVITDCNSSNGTTLNGIELMSPVELKNGDRINLGGGIDIRVEFIDPYADKFEDEAELAADSDKASDVPAPSVPAGESTDVAAAATGNPSVVAATTPSATAPKSEGSMLKTFFIIAPIFAVLILIFVGVLALLFGGRKKEVKPDNDDFAYTSDRGSKNNRKPIDDDEDEDATPTPKPKDTPGSSSTPSSSPTSSSTPDNSSTPPPPVSNDNDKLERSALPFMKRIAINDGNYAFTQKQLNEINNQVKSFKGSGSLRNNLKAVKKDASKFEELAKSKGLKPQFLATAALTKIGNQNQDPFTVAQGMLPLLSELKITLGNELSDENLLIIAAYDVGDLKDPGAMRTTLEVLAKQSPGVPTNKIRTIWYLRDKGKITESQYNFALRFLAIGAITQNPKDFSVDTEAVTF